MVLGMGFSNPETYGKFNAVKITKYHAFLAVLD